MSIGVMTVAEVMVVEGVTVGAGVEGEMEEGAAVVGEVTVGVGVGAAPMVVVVVVVVGARDVGRPLKGLDGSGSCRK